jgi:hypothetical protein
MRAAKASLRMSLVVAGAMTLLSGASRAQDLKAIAPRLEMATGTHELDAVVNQVEATRQRVEAGFIDLLRGSDSSAIKARACYILGLIGDEAAADALIANIDLEFHSAQLEDMRISRYTRFPCALALGSLGKGALKPTVELLATSDSSCKQDLGLDVLDAISGQDGAAEILRDAVARKRGTESKRLQKALGILEGRHRQLSCTGKNEPVGRRSRDGQR